MGEGILVKCRKCRYRKKFILGVGQVYDRLENVLEILKGKNKREILEILNNHEVSSRNFYHALHCCIGCGSLYDRLHVRISYNGGREFITKFVCEDCEDELRVIDVEDVISLPCPRCKTKSLTKEVNLIWD